jgi:endonuclease YncB( thermonuclease family)
MNAPVRQLKRPYGPVYPAFGRRGPSGRRWSPRRPIRPVKRLLAMAIILGAIAIGFHAAPYLSGDVSGIVAQLPYADTLRRWMPERRADVAPVPLPPFDGKIAKARPMPICGEGYRVNCVVDGDTVWVDREKIRIETIDAPEVHGKCPYETDLAARATRRLQALLSEQRMTIARHGNDIYGRTLARISTDAGEVGGILASEGLARRWTGHREPWC